MHDLDSKLDRIARRVEARRTDVRTRLAALDREFLPGCDAAKETFAARLVYLRIGDYVTGEIPEWDRWPKVLASEIGEKWVIHEPRRR